VINWDNLAKSYERRRLFSGLTGSVECGSGLLVMGANGSGKSTFLKILAGLVRPDSGVVCRPGDRNGLGYAAPHMSVYGELSGAENVQFIMALRGVKADRRSAVDILARLGLARAANKASATYSTGMLQRLRIACAIAHNPSILILDEPTIGLDRDGVSLVEQLVAEHVAEGAGGGAIIATNEPEHFARFAGNGWTGIEMGS
jgi:ABC-type multidrug transport system ATPase subunit